MIGFHFQKAVDDWPRAVAALPPGTPIKAVDNVQLLAEAKSWNPTIKTILRHWYDPEQKFEGDYMNRARVFLVTFIDGTFDNYAADVDYIEGWNEYLANSQNADEKLERWLWVNALCAVWQTEYRIQSKYNHIRLIVANAAIGNDIPVEIAQTAYEHDAVLGYHAYMPWKDGQRLATEGPWYSQRWQVMDAAYREQGIFCDWMFTEMGPLNYTENPNGGIFLDGGGGWRHKDVCNGDIVNYNDSIGEMIDEIAAFNAVHDGRCLGGVLFTTNGNASEVWKSFETAQPEMDAIAAFVSFYVPEVPPIPPEPPPPPEDDMTQFPIYRITEMSGFGPNEATEKLHFRLLHNEAGANIYTDWQKIEIDVPPEMDLRGIQVRAANLYTVPPPAADIVPYGVDVSHWQGQMDWQAAKAAGVNFAFFKATESDNFIDGELARNRTGCADAGILWGAYHFYRFNKSPDAQADFFMDAIGVYNGNLPPVVDVEDTANDFNANDLLTFIQNITGETGRTPIIYTGSWYWPGGVSWAKFYPLWEADYTTGEPSISPDWLTWTFHQYTSSGDGPAHGAQSDNIDLNRFNGTWEQLLAL